MAATAIVYLLAAYFAAGAIFAAAFVVRGIERLDSQAAGTGIAFRLFIFPGVAALWPVLLKRWYRGAKLP